MRLIMILLSILTVSFSNNIYCEEGYTKIDKKLDELKVTWCKSAASIQDNYFYIQEVDNHKIFKINHTSIFFTKQEVNDRLNYRGNKSFCVGDISNLLKKFNDKSLFFFTLVPSGIEKQPYCYQLEMIYDRVDFNIVNKNSNIQIYEILNQHTKFNTKTILPKKQPLYSSPIIDSKTKMYLIKGDKVEILEEKGDWLYILFKGKKDIKAWIPKDAIE